MLLSGSPPSPALGGEAEGPPSSFQGRGSGRQTGRRVSAPGSRGRRVQLSQAAPVSKQKPLGAASGTAPHGQRRTHRCPVRSTASDMPKARGCASLTRGQRCLCACAGARETLAPYGWVGRALAKCVSRGVCDGCGRGRGAVSTVCPLAVTVR